MRILIIIAVYILTIFIARWLNYLLIKRDEMNKPIVLAWIIPIMNIVFIIVSIGELIVHWYEHSSKSRLSRWFLGEKWRADYINPDDEQKLNNIDIKTIEQYLRKKKLKKLK